MTNVPVEVITLLQGRPRRSRAEKGRTLAASLAPGGCVGVARGPGADQVLVAQVAMDDACRTTRIGLSGQNVPRSRHLRQKVLDHRRIARRNLRDMTLQQPH